MVILDPSNPAHVDHTISTGGRIAQRIWYPAEPLFESTQMLLVQACNESKEEVCGFIAEEDQEIYYVDNVHLKPSRNFLMDSDDAERILTEIYTKRKSKVIGIFHTHPNDVPWPSPRDICGWPNPDLHWRYWVVTNGDVCEWELG